MSIESSLLYTKEDGIQDFVHDSYKDFFLARWFANRINDGRLSVEDAYRNYWSYEEDAELWDLPKDREWRALLPGWKDVLRNLIGMLDEDKALDLLRIIKDSYSNANFHTKDYNPFFGDLIFSCGLLHPLDPNLKAGEIATHIGEIVCAESDLFSEKRRKAITAIGTARNNQLGEQLDLFISKYGKGEVSLSLPDFEVYTRTIAEFDSDGAHDYLLSLLNSYDKYLKEIKDSYPGGDKPITATDGGIALLLTNGSFAPLDMCNGESHRIRDEYRNTTTLLNYIRDAIALCSISYDRIHDKLEGALTDEAKASLLYVLLKKDKDSIADEIKDFLENTEPDIRGYAKLKGAFYGLKVEEQGTQIPINDLRNFIRDKVGLDKPKRVEMDKSNLDFSVLYGEGDEQSKLISYIIQEDIEIPPQHYQAFFPKWHNDKLFGERIGYLAKRLGDQVKELFIAELDKEITDEAPVKCLKALHIIAALGVLKAEEAAEKTVNKWLSYHHEFLELKNPVGDYYMEGQDLLINNFLAKIDQKVGLPLIRKLVRESLHPMAYHFGYKYLEEYHKVRQPQGYNPPVKKLLT